MAEVRLDADLLNLFFDNFICVADSLETLYLDLFNNQEIKPELIISILKTISCFSRLKIFHLSLRRIQSIKISD